MADRTAYSIVSCTVVFSSISLLDAYNIPRSSCLKHVALTAILVQVMLGAGSPDAPQYRFRSDLSVTEWSRITLLKSVGGTKKRKNHIKE